jgi:hypothetical protein
MPARQSPAQVRPMFERLRKLFGAPLPTLTTTLTSSTLSPSRPQGQPLLIHRHSSRSSSKRHHRQAPPTSRTSGTVVSVRRPLSSRQQRIQTLQKQIADQHHPQQPTPSSSSTSPETSGKPHKTPDVLSDPTAKKKCIRAKSEQGELSTRQPQTARSQAAVEPNHRDRASNKENDRPQPPSVSQPQSAAAAQSLSMSARHRARLPPPPPPPTGRLATVHQHKQLSTPDHVDCSVPSPSVAQLIPASSSGQSSLSRSALPRRSSSFKHRQSSPSPAVSFIQILLDR